MDLDTTGLIECDRSIWCYRGHIRITARPPNHSLTVLRFVRRYDSTHQLEAAADVRPEGRLIDLDAGDGPFLYLNRNAEQLPIGRSPAHGYYQNGTQPCLTHSFTPKQVGVGLLVLDWLDLENSRAVEDAPVSTGHPVPLRITQNPFDCDRIAARDLDDGRDDLAVRRIDSERRPKRRRNLRIL